MKILLLGGNGSIGRRYQAVLRSLGYEFDVYDNPRHEPGSKSFVGYNHFIIATPTHTHLTYLQELSTYDHAAILCEKPLSKVPAEIKKFKSLSAYIDQKVFVVNNYNYLPYAPRNLSYNFFNTGRDGLIWDVCQLVYLAFKNKVDLEVKRESPWWDFKWGQFQVPYAEIERSYSMMVRAFLIGEYSRLWDMTDALKMSEVCANLYERGGDCEYINWSPSTDRLIALSKESIFSNRTEATH